MSFTGQGNAARDHGIGRMESRPGLFSSIYHSIKELSNESDCSHINFHNLVAPLKLLKPLLNHVQEPKIAITEAVIQSFEALDTVLIKAKELVMRYGPTCSRIYMAIHGPHFIERFEEISLDISRILSALPLASLPISDQSRKQVERCIKDLQRVRYTFESYDERTKEDIENALRDIREGHTVCNSKIKIIADKLELMTNQEILSEQCALEMEKGFVLAEKNEQEEEFINQVIDLVTQMREYMLELKQTQSQYGPPIPADFRCPLSLELMADPVIIASGQTYERAYIQRWLDQGMKTCPKTRQALNHNCLIPNFTVKALIENWCKSHNVPLPEPDKIIFHTPLLREPSQFVPEKQDSDDGISMKLSADEHEDDSEKESGRFSTEIAQEESTLVPEGVPFTDGEKEVAAGDKVNIENTQEPSQDLSVTSLSSSLDGMQQALSATSFTSSLDDMQQALSVTSFTSSLDGMQQALSVTSFTSSLDGMQHVTAEGVDILGTSSMPSCSNSSRELTSNIATVNYRYSITEIEEIGSPGKDYISSQSSQLNNPNLVAGGTSSSVSDIGDNELAFQLQLKKLVENLQANSIEVQREAVAELRLISKNEPGSRTTITNYGAIRPLVEVLHSRDLTIQENAVTTLLNLSLIENNQTVIPAAGAINSLLYVLKTGSPQARENAAATLYSISAVEENRKKIAQSGGIPPLIDLLVNGSTRGKKDAATALFKLSTCHENKVQIVRAGAVKPLVEAMDPAAGLVDKAVAALSNLATIREGRVAISTEGGISRLVEVVELGSQRAKENAAAALWQFCSNSNKFCAIVLQEGAIPPLVALSKSGTPRAKEKAELLLRHFREQRHADPARGGADRKAH
ncbi:hypothetical protein SUGI_0466560 [Cryptomeria japonica]|nr:hypothetical protein SUGI_0466560 [Cryptomeria japonica]